MSLANGHTIRAVDANSAMVVSHAVRIRSEVMAALAARELVVLRKISMTGNPVGLLSVVSSSPIQKNRAREKAKFNGAIDGERPRYALRHGNCWVINFLSKMNRSVVSCRC